MDSQIVAFNLTENREKVPWKFSCISKALRDAGGGITRMGVCTYKDRHAL